MTIRLTSTAFSFVMLTVLASHPTVQAQSCPNLVENGSFETGSIAPGFATGRPGAANILPWTIGGNSIDYVGTAWPASDGGRSVDLNGQEQGWISQDIPTQPGTQYTIKFDYSGNPEAGIALKTMTVEAAGTSTTLTYDTSAQGNTLTNMKWIKDESITFTAVSATTTIKFTGGPDNAAYGPALDNVRVSESDCGAGAYGDPHFKTWSNDWYDFHGVCDLVLVSAPEFSDKLGLDIHIRTKARYEYSFIEATAIKIGEDVLEVGSFGFYSLNGVSNAATPYTMGGKYTVHYQAVSEKQHIFSIKDGQRDAITVKTFKDMVGVHVANPNPKDFEHVVGLLGNKEGLLLARDGATIMDNHDLFGQEWQVQPESEGELFVSPSLYKNQCVPPSVDQQAKRRLGEASVNVETATKACAHYNDAMQREMCIFDVMAMADLEVAEGVHGAF